MNKPNIVVLIGTGIRVPPEDSLNTEPVLRNFLEQLIPVSENIYTIMGNIPCKLPEEVQVIRIKGRGRRDWMPISAIRFLIAQLRICYYLGKISKNVDTVILYTGTRPFVLPILCSKLLRKRTISYMTGKITRSQVEEMGRFSYYTLEMLEKLNILFADQLAVESPCGINHLGLNKFRQKIVINGALYIDTNLFKKSKDIQTRRNLVGYIGRLAEGKGIESFIQAIPLMLKERSDLEFLIGGGGLLSARIEAELKKGHLKEKLRLIGWIPHDELPKYLNELKLFILPSCSEGLPSAIQEAMACGTIVLTTAVGCIPDLIKDGKTGFILEDNSPECIAKGVIHALEHPDLGEISRNARKLIEDEYTYEPMVGKCRKALLEL